MAIRIDLEQTDAQGLPVVTWEEDRNLFAPEGAGPARVACFIRPDPVTGVLQFVALGSVRHGSFEEARPWEQLRSFEKGSGDQLYRSPSDRAALELLASKSKTGLGRLLTTDGAHIILANFVDERASEAMHLNCAEASVSELGILHNRLHREFIVKRAALLSEVCGGSYRWPKEKAFTSFQPPAPATVSSWKVRLADLSIAVLLALIALTLYEFVL